MSSDESIWFSCARNRPRRRSGRRESGGVFPASATVRRAILGPGNAEAPLLRLAHLEGPPDDFLPASRRFSRAIGPAGTRGPRFHLDPSVLAIRRARPCSTLVSLPSSWSSAARCDSTRRGIGVQSRCPRPRDAGETSAGNRRGDRGYLQVTRARRLQAHCGGRGARTSRSRDDLDGRLRAIDRRIVQLRGGSRNVPGPRRNRPDRPAPRPDRRFPWACSPA